MENKPATTAEGVELLAEKEELASWAAAYDLTRPSGEVDSRAKSVLVVSLVLIALSLSADRPNSISLLGIAFQARGWLVLGIPLVFVHLYCIAQLLLAWTASSHRTDYAIADPILAVVRPLRAMQDRKWAAYQEWLGEVNDLRAKERVIHAWYEDQRRKLPNISSVSIENFVEENAHIERLRAELEQRYEARLKAAGLDNFRERMDVLWADSRKESDSIASAAVLKRLRHIGRLRSWRARLDIFAPSLLSIIALGVFAMAVFQPSWLVAVSLFLSRRPRA